MNENKYTELLIKTAAYDPSTMLLYKMAGVAKYVMNPKITQKAGQYIFNPGAAVGKVIDPAAKKTLREIITGVLNKITNGVGREASKLGQSVNNLTAARKGRAGVKAIAGAGELGEQALKGYNKEIRNELLNILKNKLTLGAAGAGVVTAGSGAAGGIYGYNKYKNSQAGKSNSTEA